MKKTMMKWISMMMAVAAATTCFAACGGNTDNSGGSGNSGGGNVGANGSIKVTYYEGGYGKEWIEYAAAQFEAQENVDVTLIPSAKLNCDAQNYIKSGRNLSDLYICASSSWIDWAAQGKIEPLTDVYETEVTTANGKVKIKDYIDQDVVNKFYMQQRAGQGEFIPWVMPWSAQPGALAYNEDLLKKIVHTDSGYKVEGLSVGDKWTTPPETVTELLAYAADVNAYSDDSGYTYVPFGWSGKAPEMFYFMIYNWWAQAQGTTTSNYQGEGTFYDFWNFGNTSDTVRQTFSLSVFDQTGIQKAIDTLRTLLIKDGAYVNSLSDASSLTPQELQKTFVSADVKTKPAITLASSYLEYETKLAGYLDSNKDGKQDVNFKFMNVPKLDNYTGKDTVYCTYEDVMFIPKQAENKELAKKFLAFLCNEDMLKNFSVTTGSIRPFNYDARTASESFSDFSKSVFETYYESERVFEYPKTVSAMSSVSYVYRFERPTLFGVVPLGTIINDFKTKSGKEIMDKVKTNLENLSLSTWVDDYGLTLA